MLCYYRLHPCQLVGLFGVQVHGFISLMTVLAQRFKRLLVGLIHSLKQKARSHITFHFGRTMWHFRIAFISNYEEIMQRR